MPNTPLEPLIEAAREHEDPEKLEAMDGMPTFPLEILNLIGYSNRFESRKLREGLGWQPTFTYEEALTEIRDSLTTGK